MLQEIILENVLIFYENMLKRIPSELTSDNLSAVQKWDYSAISYRIFQKASFQNFSFDFFNYYYLRVIIGGIFPQKCFLECLQRFILWLKKFIFIYFFVKSSQNSSKALMYFAYKVILPVITRITYQRTTPKIIMGIAS